MTNEKNVSLLKQISYSYLKLIKKMCLEVIPQNTKLHGKDDF